MDPLIIYVRKIIWKYQIFMWKYRLKNKKCNECRECIYKIMNKWNVYGNEKATWICVSEIDKYRHDCPDMRSPDTRIHCHNCDWPAQLGRPPVIQSSLITTISWLFLATYTLVVSIDMYSISINFFLSRYIYFDLIMSLYNNMFPFNIMVAL